MSRIQQSFQMLDYNTNLGIYNSPVTLMPEYIELPKIEIKGAERQAVSQLQKEFNSYT